jgi:hypothetical protein
VAKRFFPLIALAAAVALTSARALTGGTSVSAFAFAAAATALIFERPPAQGPGTPGFQIVSDPAIRPFQAPGIPATIGKTLPIDFQGNGRPDLLACHGNGLNAPEARFPACRVLRPQADGSVAEVTRQLFGTGALPIMVNPSELVTGDFNQDGRPDVFIAGSGYDAPPFPGETNGLLISNADGTYTDRSSTLPQTPTFAHSACVGDINADGRLDIYVGNVGAQVKLGPYFLIGRGDGTFTPQISGLPPQIQDLRERFHSCVLVDVDRDGYDDLALGTFGRSEFVDNIVLFNDGTGDFTRRPRTVLPPWPQQLNQDVVALDANRDGRPDLLMLTLGSYETGGFGLQMLINTGATFVDETLSRLGTSALVHGGSNCGTLRLADFNGDGWDDFYCSDGPDTVPHRFWMSNGDGTWSPVAPGVLPAGSGLGIHAVDFDGDGRRDLLSINTTSTADIRYQSYLNRTPRTVPTGGPPGQPTVTNATAAGSTLQMAWTSGAGGPPTAHRLDFFAGSAAVAILNVAAATTVSIPIPAGTAGSFSVRVTALNGAGAGPPSSLFAFTIGTSPGGGGCTAAPASPLVTGSIVAGTATVSWPAVPGATSYIISAGSTQGASNVAPPTNVGPNTTVSAGGLPPGFSAWVRVIAVSACGQSPPRDFFLSSGSTP